MSRLETADGERGGGVFPAEWGRPPGDPFSETRRVWVKTNVERRNRLTPEKCYARLAAQDRRLLWELRLLELKSRRTP